ncbi:MAG: Maf family protein [Shimia sp.]
MIHLASGSTIRLRLLEAAGVAVQARPVAVDEDALRAALTAEGIAPRDMADALAEMKALRARPDAPSTLVLGCDQILEAPDGRVLAKSSDPEDARAQLAALAGRRHALHSAAVLVRDGAPVWRHVATAHLTMRDVDPRYLDGYVARNWESIRSSVGGYKIEEEGARLFARIEGDTFTVQGLPLLPLLSHLVTIGEIDG